MRVNLSNFIIVHKDPYPGFELLEPPLLDFETVLKIHTVIAFPEKMEHHEKSMLF
jgi:hypothetical protein